MKRRTKTFHKDHHCQLSSQRRGARVFENWQCLYRSLYLLSKKFQALVSCKDNSVFLSCLFLACTDYFQGIDELECQEIESLAIDTSTTTAEGLYVAPNFLPESSFLGDDARSTSDDFLSVSIANSLMEQSLYRQVSLTTEQRAEVAAIELFGSMFRQSFVYTGNYNDFDMDRLMEQASQLD